MTENRYKVYSLVTNIWNLFNKNLNSRRQPFIGYGTSMPTWCKLQTTQIFNTMEDLRLKCYKTGGSKAEWASRIRTWVETILPNIMTELVDNEYDYDYMYDLGTLQAYYLELQHLAPVEHDKHVLTDSFRCEKYVSNWS